MKQDDCAAIRRQWPEQPAAQNDAVGSRNFGGKPCADSVDGGVGKSRLSLIAGDRRHVQRVLHQDWTNSGNREQSRKGQEAQAVDHPNPLHVKKDGRAAREVQMNCLPDSFDSPPPLC